MVCDKVEDVQKAIDAAVLILLFLEYGLRQLFFYFIVNERFILLFLRFYLLLHFKPYPFYSAQK